MRVRCFWVGALVIAGVVAVPAHGQYFEAEFADISKAGLRMRADGILANLLITTPPSVPATVSDSDWDDLGTLPFEFKSFNLTLKKSKDALTEESLALAQSCSKLAVIVQHNPAKYNLIVRASIGTQTTSTTVPGSSLWLEIGGDAVWRCLLKKL